MAQEQKQNSKDMTLEEWAETLGTDEDATTFKNDLFKRFDKSQMLSDVAFMNAKNEIKTKFGSDKFGVAIGQALKPFWQQQSGV